MKPVPYSQTSYVTWHESLVASDRPLVETLGRYREVLKYAAQADLGLLYQLLAYMFTYAKNEYRIGRGHEVSYSTPLSEAIPTRPDETSSPRYDTLFKSVPSIVNKMWRLAGDEPAATLSNIHARITDLIRTDIRTETLEGAQFLAERMNHLPGLLQNEELVAQFKDRVESVAFEPEMKMASGYFAYHGLVHFRSCTVEVQIYSALMSEWRQLSHQLYEQVRIEPIARHEFASPEARLISLGHSLHLAECEIMRLRREMKRH